MLVGTSELVEQGGLAAVLVASQGKCQGRIFRQGRFTGFGVITAALAQTWMLQRLVPMGCAGVIRCRAVQHRDADLLGIVQPQGQRIAVDAQLHGVAHGGQFYQGDPCAGDQTHIQKMLPQSACAAYGLYHSAAPDGQFL